MSVVGQRIKACRKDENLTQEDVAKKLGIGKQAVYKYETGAVTNIPLDNLEAMASMFGVSPCYLAGWSDSKLPDNERDLSKTETRLVTLYRGADDRAQRDAVRILEENQKQDTASEKMA